MIADPQRALTTASDALAFLLAGKAIVTLRSRKTGLHFTYRIRRAKGCDTNLKPFFFVSLLAGSDNVNDYEYIGTIFDRLWYRHSPKSRIAEGSIGVKAFKWAIDHLAKATLPCTLEIWHEGRCGRCGRRLTVPESIATGIGPDCAGRIS